ncbi:hypothetical protein AAII07_03135 [Microvirga sp. 0TCS3.31]
MNQLTRRLAGIATSVVVLGLGVAAPASAAPTTEPRALARLQCGMAYLDFTDWTHTSAYVVHSCTGTGTVQYDIDCMFAPDVTISHGFQGGASIHRFVHCSGARLRGVDWTIK